MNPYNMKMSFIVIENGKDIGGVFLPNVPQVGTTLFMFEKDKEYKIIDIRYRMANHESMSEGYYCDDLELVVKRVYKDCCHCYYCEEGMYENDNWCTLNHNHTGNTDTCHHFRE